MKRNKKETGTRPEAGPQTRMVPLLGLVPPEGYLSKPELATRLRRSVRTIERWQRLGVLPYVKCGRSVYYNWVHVEAELQKYIHSCPATNFTHPNE